MLETIGNVFQILGYVIVPVLLGVALYYGIRKTGPEKPRRTRDAR
jgi:hypothetical protein